MSTHAMVMVVAFISERHARFERVAKPKTKHERKKMNTKFDDLTKSLARSVTRRGALTKFGLGLAGMVLACFGLANKAEAAKCVGSGGHCTRNQDCCTRYCRSDNTCGCRSDDECSRDRKGY